MSSGDEQLHAGEGFKFGVIKRAGLAYAEVDRFVQNDPSLAGSARSSSLRPPKDKSEKKRSKVSKDGEKKKKQRKQKKEDETGLAQAEGADADNSANDSAETNRSSITVVDVDTSEGESLAATENTTAKRQQRRSTSQHRDDKKRSEPQLDHSIK